MPLPTQIHGLFFVFSLITASFMLDILAITLPIYLIIGIGYLTTRLGVFAKADMRVFGKFVIYLALPALIFNAMAQRKFSDILNISYLFAYTCGTCLVIATGWLWSRKIARLNLTSSTFYVMGMSCSNSSFVGFPILLLTLAPVAGIALALNVLIENILIIPLLLIMAERSTHTGEQHQGLSVFLQPLKRLAHNPLVIGLCAGLLVSISGMTLAPSISRTVTLFASASGALSLFVIGGTLVGLPVKGMGKRIAPITFGKLILHPLAVTLAILALPLLGLPALDPALRMAAILLAAMPMLGIYPILAQVYGKEDFTATALLVTTIASFFSLSGLLWLSKHLA